MGDRQEVRCPTTCRASASESAHKEPATQCSVSGARWVLPPLTGLPDSLRVPPVRCGALESQSVRFLPRGLATGMEFNRPHVTDAGPHASDIHPALPALIPPGTYDIIPGINGLTGREQGEMPMARGPIVPEVTEARVPGEVMGTTSDGAVHRVTNQVVIQ